MVKRYANDICNTAVFERSVISQVVCHHLNELYKLDTFCFTVGLVRPRPAPRRMREFIVNEFQLDANDTVLTSAESRHSPVGRTHKNDVVLVWGDDMRGFVAAEVWFHAEIANAEAVTLLSFWQLLNIDRNSGSAEWQTGHDPRIVATDDIITSVTYMHLRQGVEKTLLPSHLR